MYTIEMNGGEIVQQAAKSVDYYHWNIVRALDRTHGQGYAKKNPQLVGQMIQAASSECATMMMAKVAGACGSDLLVALERISDAIVGAGQATDRLATAKEGESHAI